jgi:hypothetical protein
MLATYIFLTASTAFVAIFLLKVAIKHEIPQYYDLHRPEKLTFLPTTFCFFCALFWTSLFSGLCIVSAYGLPAHLLVISVPASTIISIKLLWEY